MLNFLFLGRLMIHPQGFAANPAFQPGGRAVIDTRRLFYDGNSQGGILGGALTAVAPDFDRAVLGVPGMNYSTLLRRSSDFAPYAEGTFIEGLDTPFGLYDSYPDELERPLLISLIQMLWDRGEANGYAHHMTSDPLAEHAVATRSSSTSPSATIRSRPGPRRSRRGRSAPGAIPRRRCGAGIPTGARSSRSGRSGATRTAARR